jgi:hypothetical protein
MSTEPETPKTEAPPEAPPVSSAERIELELPQAMLRLVNGELVRDTEGIVVFRVPLKNVENIRMAGRTAWMGFVFLFVGIGLAAIGIFVCTSQWLTVPLCLLGLLSFGLGLIGLRDNGLVLLVQGEEVWIPSNDDATIISGFVASIRVKMEELRENEG